MPKITITIEDEKPQTPGGSYIRSQSASISCGESGWTDHKFFLIAANRAVVRLSEMLHVQKPDLGEIEDRMLDMATDGFTEEEAAAKLRELGFDVQEVDPDVEIGTCGGCGSYGKPGLVHHRAGEECGIYG